MPSYLVVGASRGIGFSLAKLAAADGNNTVIGLVRNVESAKSKVSSEIPDAKNIHIVRGDVDDLDSLKAAVNEVSKITGGSLDVVIANAGVGRITVTPIGADFLRDPAAFDDEMYRTFRTNVVGVIHSLALFAPLLEKGTLKKAVVISSAMGDIETINQFRLSNQAPYSISKASVNVAVAKFQHEYRDRGVLFMALSPGLVATEFGRKNADGSPLSAEATAELNKAFAGVTETFKKADPNWRGTPLTPDESAALCLDVISKATIEKNGGLMVSQNGNTNWL